MCDPIFSESGARIGHDPCAEYVKLLSEKSRLEGRCAGLEEGNARNLDAMKRQDAQMVEVLEENERIRDHSTGLHDFILWLSQRHAHDGLAKDQIIRMAAKLVAGGKWQDDHVKFDGRTAMEVLETENEALCQERDLLLLERQGQDNAKQELYDKLFPDEQEDEKEVRWKWMLIAVDDLKAERDALLLVLETADALATRAERLLDDDCTANRCAVSNLIDAYRSARDGKS